MPVLPLRSVLLVGLLAMVTTGALGMSVRVLEFSELVGKPRPLPGNRESQPNPNLLLFKGGTPIAADDDWPFSNQTGILSDIFRNVGAGPLADGGHDSALLITVPSGISSAQAGGRSGESGMVVIEVYEVPE